VGSTIPAGLAPAYEHCRRIHAEHGRTFYLATSLLPREQRPHVWALYAFARVADELIDGPEPDPAALHAFSERSLTLLRSTSTVDPVADPVLAATAHTMRAYELSPELIREFLASMTMDVSVTHYATWADLRGYMRGSAAVIGELMAPIMGASEPEAVRCAGLLGEAFQLTNFVRDVGEDHVRGRVYLPQEDLARFGVTEAMLAAAVAGGPVPQALRELVRFEVQRSLDLYAAARPGLSMVDARSRLCLETAFTLYRMILREVVAADYDVFATRVVVPTSHRFAVAARLAAGAAGRLLSARAAGRLVSAGAARRLARLR